jgi:DNA (cytosine-5)-methyltransferase 1
MIEAYKTNHNPKYAYLEPIQTFKNRTDLPKELYELDILDGSPPCSSFSMAGNRDKDWGKEKKFREGQAEQVLDTLFFDFIDLAKELQPKVVVAENVKGLLLGNAKSYVIEIYKAFEEAGYYCQHFLLNASKMGVPQRRERVFFIALRKDLAKQFLHWEDMFTEVPKIEMEFNEKEICTKYFLEKECNRKKLTNSVQKLYNLKNENEWCLGETAERMGKRSHFNYMVLNPERASFTITAKENLIYDNGYLTDNELKNIGTYPKDYNFLNNKSSYLIGMSVPPVMTAQVASNIYEQWLSKLK